MPLAYSLPTVEVEVPVDSIFKYKASWSLKMVKSLEPRSLPRCGAELELKIIEANLIAFVIDSLKPPAMERLSFAFVFPMASGHINPSLAIARSLVSGGHEVHYLCREQMRDAIEDTGALFHSDIEEQPELYEGREPGMYAALGSVMEEHGLKASLTEGRLILRELAAELMLPGTMRWLKRIKADVVLFCPLINLEAPLAAKLLDIPCASLLTTAGPGSMPPTWTNIMANVGTTPVEVLAKRRQFQPLLQCLGRLHAKGLDLRVEDLLEPVGLLRTSLQSAVTLVTTAEFLADPMTKDLQEAYGDHRFVYLGPLLDQPGAKRCAGHKFSHGVGHDNIPNSDLEAIRLAEEAKAAGRLVVLVSLGTIVTGDHPDYGWKSRPVDGEKRGLSGKELCQAAWQGAFDACATCGAKLPFILVALGPQPDALENLQVPSNVFCSPTLPQVDLLRLGIDSFLTHGGQNSFMEALSVGTPMVVCPGFGDQFVNAAKAETLGIGRKVERISDQDTYRAKVCEAMSQVMKNTSFKAKAESCAAALNEGGVSLATKVLLSLKGPRWNMAGA